jgi:hypothetical protein
MPSWIVLFTGPVRGAVRATALVFRLADLASSNDDNDVSHELTSDVLPDEAIRVSVD